MKNHLLDDVTTKHRKQSDMFCSHLYQARQDLREKNYRNALYNAKIAVEIQPNNTEIVNIIERCKHYWIT